MATGLHDFDAVTGGFQLGHFNIIAARPAMGKSAFLVWLISGMCVERQNAAVLFSLAQPSNQIMQHLFACHAKIDGNRIHTGLLHTNDFTHIEKATADIAAAPLHFVQFVSSLSDIEEQCRKLAASSIGLKIAFIDDVDFFYQSGALAECAQDGICRRLQNLARELNICVVATAQVSRRTDARKNKRPMLLDLPKQMTDLNLTDSVIFLYRDECYDPESTARGEIEIILARNRHGPVCTIDALFQGSASIFFNYIKPFPLA